MHSLRDLIYSISKRPEIYIGRPSLERLYAFIGGYLTANNEMDDHCLDGFNEFVSQKFHINTDHNWSEIIQFFSNSEQQAFEKFIKLFEEFQKANVTTEPSPCHKGW